MEILTEMVRNIVGIVLITTFLDMILPSSNMQRFVKVVMGLFILISLLNPILNLLDKNKEFEVLAWQYPNNGSDEQSISMKNKKLEMVNKELLKDNYALRIEKQMEALVKLVDGVVVSKIKVTLKTSVKAEQADNIQHVYVNVSRSNNENQDGVLVKPIEINIKKQEFSEETDDDKRIVKDIKNILCQYFACNSEDIEVVFS